MVTNLHHRTAHVRVAFGALLIGLFFVMAGTIATAQTFSSGSDGYAESSTATATFNFPSGFSRCFIRASWTQ